MARGSWISKEAAIDAMLGVGFVSATASLAIHLPNPELAVAMRLYAHKDSSQWFVLAHRAPSTELRQLV